MKQNKIKKPNAFLSLFKVRWMLIVYDALIYAIVILAGYALYGYAKDGSVDWLMILYHFLLGGGLVFWSRFFFRVYGQIWRYGGVQSYIRLMLADSIALIAYYFAQRFIPGINTYNPWMVFSVVILDTLIALAVRMVYRFIYKRLNRNTKFGRFVVKTINIFGRSDWTLTEGDPINKIKVAIVGAGGVGIGLAEELLNTPTSAYIPTCFVDIDKDKIGKEIYGKEVLEDKDDTPELLKEYNVQEVVLALPRTVSSEDRIAIYDRYKKAGFKIKSYDYPSMQNTQKGKRTLREFDVEDLLFRKEQEVITPETVNYYKDKVILVTGGGGSIGSEIARQLAKMEPKTLVLLDIYENGVYDIQQELRIQYGDKLDLHIEICSITNKMALNKVFKAFKPNIVIMAAAHKHVPLMEHNVIEAIDNNIFGTLYTVEMAEKWGADRVHMVSTDKAVNPTNVMGATKRMCEMICMSHAALNGHTTFSATRFGNVLGSAGSVIPLFKKQIANGGPITLTDKRIIRYFMTIPEASQLVLHSAAIAKNGELMVLDMGQPVKIYDLAVNMIEMAGFRPDIDIEIRETGLRPGEKLYEELLVKDEHLAKTDNEKIFIEQDAPLSSEELNEKLTTLYNAINMRSNKIAKAALHEVVPTFKDPSDPYGGGGKE
jgi:FlaA1/EpsC-like NDP-sugar epimerase